MDLNGKVISGINEFYQDRKLTETAAIGTKYLKPFTVNVFLQGLSGIFTLRND